MTDSSWGSPERALPFIYILRLQELRKAAAHQNDDSLVMAIDFAIQRVVESLPDNP